MDFCSNEERSAELYWYEAGALPIPLLSHLLGELCLIPLPYPFALHFYPVLLPDNFCWRFFGYLRLIGLAWCPLSNSSVWHLLLKMWMICDVKSPLQ